jgi:hypothetical protein
VSLAPCVRELTRRSHKIINSGCKRWVIPREPVKQRWPFVCRGPTAKPLAHEVHFCVAVHSGKVAEPTNRAKPRGQSTRFERLCLDASTVVVTIS